MSKTTDLHNQAGQALRELQEARSRAEKLIKLGNTAQAQNLAPTIDAARRRWVRACARIEAQEGGDLWQAAARVITGELVALRWESTGTQALGRAENSTPPVIVLDPDVAEPSTIYSVFLHEVGHLVDYQKRDPKATTKESREARADELGGNLGDWADRHCMAYDQIGRSGVQIRLLALLDYPDGIQKG